VVRDLSCIWAALATLAITSSAAALAPKTASGVFGNFHAPRVTEFATQAREAHQQAALRYGEVASDSSLAAKGGGSIGRIKAQLTEPPLQPQQVPASKDFNHNDI
jgi:hypothetical protein